MAEHSPGPWRYAPAGPNMRNKYSQNFAIADGTGNNLVAGTFSDTNGGDAVSKANAVLIAAAPDLVKALERSLNWLSSYPGEGASGAYEEARAALSKARGK